jgi:branched-chain amino acid aminotransferase
LCERSGIPIREQDLSLTEAYRCDEMFCSGTMGELVPVLRLDGRTIGGGETGPVTQRLTALFRELTAAEGTVVVDGEPQE